MTANAADKWGAVGIVGSAIGLIAPSDSWKDLSGSISDSTDLADIPRALYSDIAADVRAVDRFGSSATFAFAAGEIKSIRPYRIMATGTSTGLTTAGQLIGMY